MLLKDKKEMKMPKERGGHTYILFIRSFELDEGSFELVEAHIPYTSL